MKNPLWTWLIVNIIFISLSVVAFNVGLIPFIYANDTTFISSAMMLIFPIFLLISLIQSMKLQNDIDNIDVLYDRFKNIRISKGEMISFSMFSNMSFVTMSFHEFIINGYVTIGLIGTVIGVIIAFTGIDVSASTPEAISAIIVIMVNGLKVALLTTLVGAILSFWFSINNFILDNASNYLIRQVTII